MPSASMLARTRSGWPTAATPGSVINSARFTPSRLSSQPASAAAVGEAHVLVDDDVRAPFEVDWTGRYRGVARAVVRPADAREVAAVLGACREHGAGVVPQGG